MARHKKSDEIYGQGSASPSGSANQWSAHVQVALLRPLSPETHAGDLPTRELAWAEKRDTDSVGYCPLQKMPRGAS